jgi:hypothetical protein
MHFGPVNFHHHSRSGESAVIPARKNPLRYRCGGDQDQNSDEYFQQHRVISWLSFTFWSLTGNHSSARTAMCGTERLFGAAYLLA